MDCISKLTCDDKTFLNETIGKITEMIESKGDSLTQRQHEYIEMLDRVYDLKTVNKTESFLGGIVRTMGFVASTFKNQKSVSYVPDLPIIKMCMEFVYIRNNKHEYDEYPEVFDELPVSRKDFKNICHEIEKEAVNGIEHIINKYEIAKIKKINYFKFLSSGEFEDCNRALIKITECIDMDKVFEIIDNTETITEIQKKFYKTMLTERKKRILDFSFYGYYSSRLFP